MLSSSPWMAKTFTGVFVVAVNAAQLDCASAKVRPEIDTIPEIKSGFSQAMRYAMNPPFSQPTM